MINDADDMRIHNESLLLLENEDDDADASVNVDVFDRVLVNVSLKTSRCVYQKLSFNDSINSNVYDKNNNKNISASKHTFFSDACVLRSLHSLCIHEYVNDTSTISLVGLGIFCLNPLMRY
ncbi:unnamed protein product [Ceratitis capitata]|uniref:(Mediterranean fruit fly) hypothetical protein n=1 Tax=Ceratitis capitata TaxID=7213 RepID=A0A811U3S7_CERCA|nr:unnamed protein product [Ceratitis capitata]